MWFKLIIIELLKVLCDELLTEKIKSKTVQRIVIEIIYDNVHEILNNVYR